MAKSNNPNPETGNAGVDPFVDLAAKGYVSIVIRDPEKAGDCVEFQSVFKPAITPETKTVTMAQAVGIMLLAKLKEEGLEKALRPYVEPGQSTPKLVSVEPDHDETSDQEITTDVTE